MLLDALNRHRGKGMQKITVEHVHVAAPVSHLLISGTIAAGSSSTLTLKTRGGGSVTIDFSEAKRNQRIGAHLKVGAPVTVLGSTIEANGAMLAKVILRAKGASGALWPPDRQ